jgi:hypothetical protein
MPESNPRETRFIHEAEKEGSGRGMLALIAAVCLAFASIWAFIFYSQKPPSARATITQMTAVPVHTELRQSGTQQEGVGGGVEAEDQVFVLMAVSARSTAKIPIFPYEQTGTLTLPTSEQKHARALSPTDMERAFVAYPALAAAKNKLVASGAPAQALPRDTTLKPGESEQGLVLVSFPIKQEEWETRRTFDLEIPLRWQRELELAQPAVKLQP